MAIDGFDYEEFSEAMYEQAKSFVPCDIQGEPREFVLNTLKQFSFLAGEALYNDRDMKINAEQALFITQVVTEWTFHKSVDLAHSQIPVEYWDAIMQKIAFTIYEITKQGIIKELEQDAILQAAEYHANKCWQEALEEMKNKNRISDEVIEQAIDLSNIDEMAEQCSRKSDMEQLIEKQKESNDFTVKNIINSMNELAFQVSSTVESAVILAKNIINNKTIVIVAIILTVALFYFTGWYKSEKALMHFIILANIVWIMYRITENIVNNKIEEKIKLLEDVRQQIRDLVNPDKMLERLGVDVLSIRVSENLIPISDPDQEGELLSKLAASRQRLTDRLGYILPNIRVMDDTKLDEYEFKIYVRDTEALSGFVYPDKNMVFAEQFDKTGETLPDDCIVSVDPCCATQVYWIDEKDIPQNIKAGVSAEDVIITALEQTAIKHVDKIITVKDVQKYFTICYEDIMGTDIYEAITTYVPDLDTKAIFTNLIRENVSIKDIIRIFELIAKHSKKNPNPDYISEKIRNDFGAKIFLTNLKENSSVLYGLKYSQKWLDRLFLAYGSNEKGDYEFHFTEAQEKDFVEATANKLMEIYKSIGQQPVLVCPSKIRLELYRFIVKYIPSIVVMSEDEIEQHPDGYQKEIFFVE